jgi:hypothetical protein
MEISTELVATMALFTIAARKVDAALPAPENTSA